MINVVALGTDRPGNYPLMLGFEIAILVSSPSRVTAPTTGSQTGRLPSRTTIHYPRASGLSIT